MAGASNGDGGETASGGAGGSKATVTPLAGPAHARAFLHCLSRTASIFPTMIERGLLMVIQLGWWQRLVYGRQGPIMVCTSASSSGVRDFLTFISLISLSSKAATTEQPYCLAQERLWFERPLGRALCTALQAPCRGLLAMRSSSRDMSGRRPGRGWPCPGTMLGLLSMSVPIPLLFLPIFFMSI